MPYLRELILLMLGMVLLMAAPLRVLAAPPVSLEFILEPGSPPTEAHRWLELLKGLEADLRIRGARPGDRIAVEQRGSDAAPRYHVTGLITSRSVLRLPGGEFRYGDKAGVQQWLTRLRSGGLDGLSPQSAPFGLTEKQFSQLFEQLAAVTAGQTKDRPPSEIVRQITDQLPMKIVVDASAGRTLANAEAVRDQLQGLSAGTSLAAVLRPLGLALTVKTNSGSEVELHITPAKAAGEFWPIGWPLPPDRRPAQALPSLLKFLNVEIEGVSLEEALTAIAQRLETPLLLDHNNLALQGIDPATTQVSLPKERTFYKRALDRLLFQARLKEELRVDEAGKPFLWVTTIK